MQFLELYKQYIMQGMSEEQAIGTLARQFDYSVNEMGFILAINDGTLPEGDVIAVGPDGKGPEGVDVP